MASYDPSANSARMKRPRPSTRGVIVSALEPPTSKRSPRLRQFAMSVVVQSSRSSAARPPAGLVQDACLPDSVQTQRRRPPALQVYMRGLSGLSANRRFVWSRPRRIDHAGSEQPKQHVAVGQSPRTSHTRHLRSFLPAASPHENARAQNCLPRPKATIPWRYAPEMR